jgi:hypothetical protein
MARYAKEWAVTHVMLSGNFVRASLTIALLNAT